MNMISLVRATEPETAQVVNPSFTAWNCSLESYC